MELDSNLVYSVMPMSKQILYLTVFICLTIKTMASLKIVTLLWLTLSQHTAAFPSPLSPEQKQEMTETLQKV